MDKKKLKEIIDAHAFWLAGGDGECANLRRANLCHVHLPRANLSDVDLSGADLGDSDLNRASLCDADLSNAYLIRANLVGANLICANLSGADLKYAKLKGADLFAADLFGADLSGADLSGADLKYAKLKGANLFAADLSRADLAHAKLENVVGDTKRIHTHQFMVYTVVVFDSELQIGRMRYSAEEWFSFDDEALRGMGGYYVTWWSRYSDVIKAIYKSYKGIPPHRAVKNSGHLPQNSLLP